MLRYVRPWVLDYVDRSRAKREGAHQEFMQRLRAAKERAIAVAAVNEQEIGE